MNGASAQLDHAVGFDEAPAPVLTAPMHRVGGSVRFLHELSPLRIAGSLWDKRGVLWQFAQREFSARHRGSALGLFWAVLQPVLMLAVYTFVFAVVWSAKWNPLPAAAGAVPAGPGDTVRFALTVFAGLIVWEIFASCVSAAPSIILSNTNFVKKVVFPLEVLPLAQVIAAVLLSLVSVLVLLAGLIFSGIGLSKTIYLFPLVLIPAALLAGGVSLFVASIGVFLRDIRPIVNGILLQVLFFLTPIFYPIERIPEWMRGALSANPMATIVESARRTLVFGTMPDWPALGIAWLVALAIFALGWAWFLKSKRGFADVL